MTPIPPDIRATSNELVMQVQRNLEASALQLMGMAKRASATTVQPQVGPHCAGLSFLRLPDIQRGRESARPVM
jgi:hypothetical protein